VAAFVAEVRELTLFKRPGIAETLDWCKALCELDRGRLDADTVQTTLGALLKYEDDIARVDAETTAQLLGQAAVRAAALDRGD
jgi:hypothetical protein